MLEAAGKVIHVLAEAAWDLHDAKSHFLKIGLPGRGGLIPRRFPPESFKAGQSRDSCASSGFVMNPEAPGL